MLQALQIRTHFPVLHAETSGATLPCHAHKLHDERNPRCEVLHCASQGPRAAQACMRLREGTAVTGGAMCMALHHTSALCDASCMAICLSHLVCIKDRRGEAAGAVVTSSPAISIVSSGPNVCPQHAPLADAQRHPRPLCAVSGGGWRADVISQQDQAALAQAVRHDRHWMVFATCDHSPPSASMAKATRPSDTRQCSARVGAIT